MQIDPGRIAHWKTIVAANPELLRSTLPRLNRYIPHLPTPKQAAFLVPSMKEGFFGGAARGGKTDALLMGALQYVDYPQYSALILRRTFGMLNLPDSILERAHRWLRGTDARWEAMHNRFVFPSGAKLQFGYLQHFKDVYQYDSASFHCIIFDELTQFLESQYRFLFGRLSKGPNDPIPLRMLSASNPGGIGHMWVKDRFIRNLMASRERYFIPARLEDNPHIDQASYRRMLAELDPITRKQREEGDWDVQHEGTMFKREWFREFVDSAPKNGVRVRFWDMAASDPGAGKDPDWTVGTLMNRDQGRFYVEDVSRLRATSAKVEERVINTAKADGRSVKIRMEQEPGASGKSMIAFYARLLAGYDFKGITASGPKVSRWMPMASQAEKGNVIIVNGPWNHEWFEEMCSVPDADHDDQADSAAGAFNTHTLEPPVFFGVSRLMDPKDREAQKKEEEKKQGGVQ